MPGYDEAFKAIAINAMKMNPPEEGDYYDKDGNLICGKCHTPRSERKEFFGELMDLAIPCKCRQEAERREEHREKVKSFRKRSMIPVKYDNATFDSLMPDSENSRSVKIVKRFAETFPERMKKNEGLLIYGSVGSGKTHIAVCAANAIIDSGYSVMFLSVPEYLQGKKGFESQDEEILARVRKVSLLIVDDLGAERNTEFAQEFVYALINARVNSNKPMIVTTNLGFDEMLEAEDRQHKRIYNRVFEACSFPVEFVGKSKRITIAEKKYDSIESMFKED